MAEDLANTGAPAAGEHADPGVPAPEPADAGEESYVSDLSETLAESKADADESEGEDEGYARDLEATLDEKAEAASAEQAKGDFDTELDELCAPYKDQLEAAGLGKHDAVRRLFNAEAALRRDPAGAMAWLAQNYAASLPPAQQAQVAQQVMAALGFTDVSQLGRAEAAELQQWRQVGQVLQQQHVEQRQSYAAVEQQVARQIQAFAQTRPDFDGLRPLMAALVQSNEAQGLADAYAKARQLRGQGTGSVMAPADAIRRAKAARTPRTASVAAPVADDDGDLSTAEILKMELRKAAGGRRV